MSTYLLLMLLLPGALFYVVAGKRNQLDTPSGWLVATLIGLLISTLVALLMYIPGGKKIVKTIALLWIGEKTISFYELKDMLWFMGFVYSASLASGLGWRLLRSRLRKVNSALLKVESSFFDEGIMISKNILENFLLAASVAQVVPDILIRLRSGEDVHGRCISYQWVKPKRLTVVTEEENVSFIDLDSIEIIHVLNFRDFKDYKAVKDPWHYLRLVDKRLPEALGLKDERGG